MLRRNMSMLAPEKLSVRLLFESFWVSTSKEKGFSQGLSKLILFVSVYVNAFKKPAVTDQSSSSTLSAYSNVYPMRSQLLEKAVNSAVLASHVIGSPVNALLSKSGI